MEGGEELVDDEAGEFGRERMNLCSDFLDESSVLSREKQNYDNKTQTNKIASPRAHFAKYPMNYYKTELPDVRNLWCLTYVHPSTQGAGCPIGAPGSGTLSISLYPRVMKRPSRKISCKPS